MTISEFSQKIGFFDVGEAGRVIRQQCRRVLVGSGHEAWLEDAVQGTWIRVIRAVQKGQGPKDSPEGWLRRIAHRVALNLIRDHHRHIEVMELGDEMDTLASLLEDSARLSWRSLLRRLSARLSDRQRKIWKLAMFQMTQAEIAQELGLSASLVCGEIKAIKAIIDSLCSPDDDNRPSSGARRKASSGKRGGLRGAVACPKPRAARAVLAGLLGLPAFRNEDIHGRLVEELSDYVRSLPAFLGRFEPRTRSPPPATSLSTGGRQERGESEEGGLDMRTENTHPLLSRLDRAVTAESP